MSAEPQFDAEQEVRFAIVLYGGASLAIYLYGVAEEFLHMVRATAPARSTPAGPVTGDLAYEAESTEAVYRKLGQMIGLGGIGEAEGPVRSRFVVDVISGTSAGGINGVCLAKALANGTTVAGLKKLWLTDGDIAGLVNDRSSVYEPGDDGEPTSTLITDLSPDFTATSLLNSDRMFVRLVTALGSMTAPDPNNVPPLVDELDLYVTATDLSGNRLATQLWNTTSWERRHANRYHFRRAPQEDRDDFQRRDNSFLAFAARCTSAFPFAFSAMTLNDIDRFAGAKPIEETWSHFYPDYVTGDFPVRGFSDGGILDNKPFSYATGALVGRRAPLPVDRKLIYVEPDPGDPPPEPLAPEPARQWNGIQTAQAALLKIPRVEGIRNDIQTVLRRNREIERARDIVSRAATDQVEYESIRAVALETDTAGDWGELYLSDTVRRRNWGPSYATYHRLKVRGVVDYLATLVVRAAPGFSSESDDVLAVHYLVRAWKDALYSEQPKEGHVSENRLLLDFSLPYRWRRLSFVLKKLGQLTSDDPEVAARALAACGLKRTALPADPDPVAVVRELRARLTAAADELYAADRKLAASTGPLPPLLGELGIGRKQIEHILDTSDDDEMLRRADAVVKAIPDNGFDKLIEVVSKEIGGASDRARALLNDDEALGPQTTPESVKAARGFRSTLRYALRFYYDAFEAFDLLLYPLEYGTVMAETNPVEILRISPRECTRPDDITPRARMLRGTTVHHFGAFFDLEWRKHDMLWGRLNASETLIRSLLPAGHPKLDELIDEAHRTIVAEFAAERVPAVPEGESWDWFKTYDPPVEPDKPRTITVLDRAGTVLGTVMGGILAPTKAAPGWSALASVMRPNPGGMHAVRRVAKLLFLRNHYGQVALATWIALLVTGICLIVFDVSLALGIFLVVLAALLAGAVLVGLWVVIAKIRATLEKRVGVFIFGPPSEPPAAG